MTMARVFGAALGAVIAAAIGPALRSACHAACHAASFAAVLASLAAIRRSELYPAERRPAALISPASPAGYRGGAAASAGRHSTRRSGLSRMYCSSVS